MRDDRNSFSTEWPTLLLLITCYATWMVAVFTLPQLSLWLAVALAALAAVLHSSLSHEVIHGHPFRSDRLNAALVALPLTVFIPYGRFRDTHLAHHFDERLTDPYDDPESNYLDPAVWGRMAWPLRALLRANNTLLGRMLLGPIIGQVTFMAGDLRLIRQGHRRVLNDWLIHCAMALVLLVIVLISPLPVWAWLLSVWIALAVLKIRTFLEHRAHEKARARTVVVEDRGILALLFLNNNFHVVHHMHPKTPWHRLPAIYAANRDHYLGRNGGYRYRSYAQIFRHHLLRAKDPVPHPLYPWDKK